MGKIVSYLKIWIADRLPVKEHAKEQWVESQLLNAHRTAKKIRQVIPDQPRYVQRIAEASSKTWGKMLNPDFVSRHEQTAKNILARHTHHLEAAYHKWDEHIERAYGTVDGVEAKYFKDHVQASAEHYAKASVWTMAMTGDHLTYTGPAVVVPLWLTADPYIVGNIGPADRIGGAPINIIKGRHTRTFRSALEQLLVQSGVLILKHDKDGTTMAAETERVNELVNLYVDKTRFAEFSPGGPSHVDFGNEPEGLFIEVQVSEA
ncbi:MAG: hypothetical protein V1701_06705 [Planctomycetota bacterium]